MCHKMIRGKVVWHVTILYVSTSGPTAYSHCFEMPFPFGKKKPCMQVTGEHIL